MARSEKECATNVYCTCTIDDLEQNFSREDLYKEFSHYGTSNVMSQVLVDGIASASVACQDKYDP